MHAPTIDVVIVTADTKDMTEGCVDDLLSRHSSGSAALVRIVIVDNASEDGTVVALRSRFGDRVDVLELGRAHGFAAACNRGAERGSAPFVLYLNSDILGTRDAIETLLAELRGDPEAVAAGGRLVDPKSLETQAEYRPRPFPRLANFVVVLTGIEERWPGNPITRRYHGGEIGDWDTTPVDQPAAAALLVRREQVEAVGGFDERFWFWFEDSDFLRRLQRRGTVLYVPAAAFRHLGGGTFRRWSKEQRIRSIHHGIAHYGDAQFSRSARLGLGGLLLAVSLPRLMLFAATPRKEELSAWRAVARAGIALTLGRPVPAIAP